MPYENIRTLSPGPTLRLTGSADHHSLLVYWIAGLNLSTSANGTGATGRRKLRNRTSSWKEIRRRPRARRDHSREDSRK